MFCHGIFRDGRPRRGGRSCATSSVNAIAAGRLRKKILACSEDRTVREMTVDDTTSSRNRPKISQETGRCSELEKASILAKVIIAPNDSTRLVFVCLAQEQMAGN